MVLMERIADLSVRIRWSQHKGATPERFAGKWARIVMDMNSTITLISSLIHSLPVGVEIDHEVLISDPVWKCG